uniref:Ubiquitin carboxyl-terminal hydrolase n=1 Tax=Arcella intermedia TaxID=1963864 RepID=A0A6B2L9V9_9EUKA
MIEGIGVKGLQVEELYVLDDAVFEEIKPIYGLVFLFKYEPSVDNRPICDSPDVYFAKQVVPNACATQAILSILLNSKGISLGPALTEFKDITRDFPPEVKGLAIGNQAVLKKVHNSFSRPEPFSIEKDPSLEAEDAFHFLSYLPINGTLYELDGLKAGPIALAPCTDDNWLQQVKPFIQKRIDTYSKSEIRFNLMAIIKNRKDHLVEVLGGLQVQKGKLEEAVKARGDAMEITDDDLATQLRILEERMEQTEIQIASEEERYKNWKAENQRRKHNYIPFLFNLLKVLGEKDQLLPLLEKAKEKQKQRAKEKQKQ